MRVFFFDIDQKRNPFEVFLLVACLLASVVNVLGAGPPNSIRDSLPHWAQYIWEYLLLGGALVALIGLWWPRKKATSYIIEQVGLAAVGNGCAFYGIAVLFFAGPQGVVAAFMALGFGAACLWRYGQIESLLHEAIKEKEKRGA